MKSNEIMASIFCKMSTITLPVVLKIISILLLSFIIIFQTFDNKTYGDNNCEWSMYGYDSAHTFSVPKACSPKLPLVEIDRFELKEFNWYDHAQILDAVEDYILISLVSNDDRLQDLSCYKLNPSTKKWFKYQMVKHNSSPAIIRNLIYIFNGNSLRCYNMDTGLKIWDFNFWYSSYMTPWYKGNIPIIYNDKLYYDTYCFDLLNGKKLFSFLDDGYNSIPTIFEGFLYMDYDVTALKSGESINTIKHFLRCFKADSGQPVWEKEHNYGTLKEGLSLMYKNGLLFANSYPPDENASPELVCFNAKNGDLVWSQKNQFNVCATNNGILSQSITSKVKDAQYLYCNDYKTGNNIWTKQITFLNNEDNSIIECISDGDYIFLRISDGRLLILDAKTSEEIITINNNFISKPIISNRQLFIISKNNLGSLTLHRFISQTLILEFKLGSKTMKLDEFTKDIDTPAQMIVNTTYLPAKYLVDSLGGSVDWDTKEKKITCKLAVPSLALTEKKENVITMFIGKPMAKINGKEVQIDPKNPKITPIIINGRTMVPVRFLAESLGCEVKWDANTKTITIEYKP